eukprot:m.124067 g.124067  ORF g.124067 m.124067 type:complete len:493 (-) comp9342_c0_seq4:1100-2578(-)
MVTRLVRLPALRAAAMRMGSSAVPPRSESFSAVGESDLVAFRSILGNRVLTAPDDVAPFNEDWMRKYHGHSKVVLRPKTTAEVSAILKHCNERKIAVTPQGGNTGLVGGGVPVHDEVVLSLSLMDKVISIDDVSGVVVCQAGCVLQALEERLERNGFAMPLDLGAKGSCQIGGNVSTNAGGLRLLRYGSLHGSILGLEVVRADGTVLDLMSGLRKDNTGYHLSKLFIGAEGTLGVVTSVSLLAPPMPKAVNVAFLGCESFAAVIKTYKAAREHLGEVLSACEFLDDDAMRVTEGQPSLGARNPLSGAYPFYVLVETRGASEKHDSEKVSAFLDAVLADGTVVDGTMAQDHKQIAALWALREKITVALKLEGYVYKYDISLPMAHLYELVERARERVKDLAISCVGYGHLGDGNLHLNITSKEYNPELFSRIEPFVYEFAAGVRGSISAEHGLGLMKAHDIHYSKPPAAVAAMKELKALFDPNGILNPYKTLP